jgi:hypothetical protein
MIASRRHEQVHSGRIGARIGQKQIMIPDDPTTALVVNPQQAVANSRAFENAERTDGR